MIKCWEKRTEAILPVFFRFRQVSFYIEIFENFYTKRLQVRKIYLSLHSRLRKTSNTAEHGAVVQLVRMRACHARGRGFEPHPHRLKALHESEGLFRIWHLPRRADPVWVIWFDNNADPFECKVTGIQVTDNSMTVIAHEKEANFEATCHTPFELGASNIDWLQQMYDAVWQQLEENRDNNA